MSEYVVLFPADDEEAWEAGSPADHQSVFDVDGTFARRLAERGGRITGGAGLGPGRDTTTLTRGASGPMHTQGPYAESVEQLSGFYLVTCSDRRALVEAAEVLLEAHPVVEIRAVAQE